MAKRPTMAKATKSTKKAARKPEKVGRGAMLHPNDDDGIRAELRLPSRRKKAKAAAKPVKPRRPVPVAPTETKTFTTALKLRHAIWIEAQAEAHKTTPGVIIENVVRLYYADWRSKNPGGGSLLAQDFKDGVELPNTPPTIGG